MRLSWRESPDRLFCYRESVPIDLLLVRDDDIPGLIASGLCDLGVVGRNVPRAAMERAARRHNGAMKPHLPALLASILLASHVQAAAACSIGTVFEDRDGDGRHDPGEPGVAGIALSNGRDVVRSDRAGRYQLPRRAGAETFVLKPAGYRLARRADGLPDHWRVQGVGGDGTCAPIALRRDASAPRADGLDVLIFGDPQPKSPTDVGHYRRGIIAPLMRAASRVTTGAVADLGLTLGDVTDDEPALYPALNRATAELGVPWLHAPGNHDIDPAARDDAASLASFRRVFGPDTFAWEEPGAVFVVLDDVIWQPGQAPNYIGGLREDQFVFLENYLRDVPKARLLVLAMHIPLFEPAGRDTFRDADRERLFALLRDFPRVLVLSAHNHTQQHVFHDTKTGWHGARPLHEYNVGATCGAFWSGAKDAIGVPDSTMADGTPKGWARMRVRHDGSYALSYHPARDPDERLRLHAPRLLRRGAYPAWGVYANVYMGRDDSVVEYRVDGGAWQPMRRVPQPDPWLTAENRRDDEAAALRGYDRSPEATPSPHLWRGALPTHLSRGEHEVEVRVQDAWSGPASARIRYRLEDARP